jgi:large subunit ribosomal protein L28
MKHFDSELLGRERMRFKVTTRALKTIKKYGGLDNYLLGVRTKFLGEQGMRVRLILRNELRRREDEAIFAEAVRAPRSLGWTKVSTRLQIRDEMCG